MRRYEDDGRFFLLHVAIMDESVFRLFDAVVFEGAQGLMLDQNNLDYFPHLTPSNTGLQNISDILQQADDVEVCYVSRTYLTRHGAGPFPTECPMAFLGVQKDATNHTNAFQGYFRYGYFDPCATIKAIRKDMDHLKGGKAVFSLCLTHADETDNALAFKNARLPIDQWYAPQYVGIPVRYVSHGPTHRCVLSS